MILSLLISLLAMQDAPVLTFSFDHPSALDGWRFTDAGAWRSSDAALAQVTASEYEPPFRSPFNIAVMPLHASGSFVLEAELMQTGREYGHRDMCLFFGVESPDRLLYVHISSGADAVGHQIHVVDRADRTPITTERNDGVDWGRDAWRRIRLEVDAEGRRARVLFEGEEIMRCDALPWTEGYIGFGSFDDEGRIDDIRVAGTSIETRVPDFWEPIGASEEVAGDLITFDDDGAWCWFQDERCIIVDDTLFIGSISAGNRQADRRGDVNVIVHDLGTGSTRIIELHDRLQRDDHNNPGLLALPDGRVLALYTMHGNDRLVRMRSASPADPGEWSPEKTLSIEQAERGVTYSNVYLLSEANGGRGRIDNFFRGAGWDPTVITSDDLGATWSYGGRVLHGDGRPYVRYASDGKDTIHFTCTDQHPRDADNSIYHGFLRDGGIHTSDGRQVGRVGESPVEPSELTRVFAGNADNVAWCSNIEMDDRGDPVIVYSVQKDSAGLPVGEGGEDCRYRYARWDGERWVDHEVCHGGERLYPREDDYTGLICIDPADATTVYCSTNADPITGEPLVSRADGQRHYEIYRGRTSDGGASWSFEPITRNSSVDNLRPMMPESRQHGVLLWLRGRYTTMHDFDQAVVGIRFQR